MSRVEELRAVQTQRGGRGVGRKRNSGYSSAPRGCGVEKKSKWGGRPPAAESRQPLLPPPAVPSCPLRPPLPLQPPSAHGSARKVSTINQAATALQTRCRPVAAQKPCWSRNGSTHTSAPRPALQSKNDMATTRHAYPRTVGDWREERSMALQTPKAPKREGVEERGGPAWRASPPKNQEVPHCWVAGAGAPQHSAAASAAW